MVMPLRDHFHPPLKDRRPWESWHSLWPGLIVQRLPERLPSTYYAVAYRFSKENEQWHLATWNERLTVGESLPTLPLWLASDLAVPLELEASYEEACRVLRI